MRSIGASASEKPKQAESWNRARSYPDELVDPTYPDKPTGTIHDPDIGRIRLDSDFRFVDLVIS